MYAGYTICTSREHIVYGAFCGSTTLSLRSYILSIKSEVPLIRVQFYLKYQYSKKMDRRADKLQLAIMNHGLIMLDDKVQARRRRRINRLWVRP